jgi:DNA replication protein DnaC
LTGAGGGKVTVQRLGGLLSGFGLKHSAGCLADMLGQAESDDLTPREFLLGLLEAEVKGRNERRRHRNYAGAHFPARVRTLEEFDPSELESGITAGQLRKLSELGWVETAGNVILAGPPGLGKTMVALGLGLKAIDEGYTVCFEKMGALAGILERSGIERAARFRLNNIRKADVAIIDEIGYTPISRDQANRFFTLVSEKYERGAMVFTTNKDVADWAEVMGDPTLTKAMLDRVLHHAHCFYLRGESYRLKHPRALGGGDDA